MSGMEPLAALSLVCNILQLVEVGSQSYELIKNVYQKGSIDDSLQEKAIMLEKISEDIKPVNRPAKKHEHQLVETAETCARAARQLREEIIYLVRNAKRGRLSSSVKTALMTLWRKPRLERLKNELDEAEKLMHTSLLVQIMSIVNDAELDLTDLAADVRAFVREYQKGHLETKRLVSREGLETRTHVSTTIQSTNEAIEGVSHNLRKLALSVDVQFDQAKGERLLQSLKYPGLNERRNEVGQAHTDTFRWVFAGDGGELAESDSKMSTVKWDSFSNWLKSTDNIYWINGKPGSGKSTMVKYILADPQTQQCLDIWSPGCLTISHYFWRPGNPLQRSIKGLLCSLLRQLLENSKKALGQVLASVTCSSIKDDVTDWSLEELRSTLLRTLEAYERPICMFLDGLDEVYPESPTTLLDKIKELSITGKTKMCLASRPEPPLQRRLYNMPQLRLQDLTASDLTQYVYDNIEESNFFDIREYENFVRSLVKQAEGVFLWLVLVTKSVRNGFDNGDNIKMIKERVESLQSGDLDSLYKDMWDRTSRANPDAYRRNAAQYFRIMLLSIHRDHASLQIYPGNPSVLTMMFATTELAHKTLDAAHQPRDLVTEEALLQGCKDVEKIAEIYCFGLLEVSQPDDDNIIEETIGWYGGDYDKLLVYAPGRKALRFIHRTAMDFLVDTEQGQKILSFDGTSEVSHALRLVKANLAYAQLFCKISDMLQGSCAIAHLYCMGAVREDYIDADEPVTADYTHTMICLQRLCDLERIFAGKTLDCAFVCSGVDFFKAVAMYNWRCLDIFEDQIKALDRGTLSEILHMLCNPCKRSHAFDPKDIFEVDFLRSINGLLSEGADPNWNGTTNFVNMELEIKGESHFPRGTPFLEFLSHTLGGFQRRYGSGKELSRNELTKLLATLQKLLRSGADLDENFTIVFQVTRVQSGTAESPDTRRNLGYAPFLSEKPLFFGRRSSTERHKFICSFPAYDILNLVLTALEPLRDLPSQGEILADVKSSIASSACRHSRINDSVLERFEVTGSTIPTSDFWNAREWRWCVAPRQHQEQIAKELMSLMTLSGIPVDISRRKPSAATQALGYETLTSMLCGPHWVETGSGFQESVFDHLVNLGLVVKYSVPANIHNMQDWLKLKEVLKAT